MMFFSTALVSTLILLLLSTVYDRKDFAASEMSEGPSPLTTKTEVGQKDLTTFWVNIFIHSTGECSGAHVDSLKLWNMLKKQKYGVGEFHSSDVFHKNFVPYAYK